MKLPFRYTAKIPNEYRDEYIHAVCRENLSRMLVISVLLVIIESLLAIFSEPANSPSFYLALWIALLSLFFIPVLSYFKGNVERIHIRYTYLVQALFLVGILMGGITWSLYEQSSLASSSTYFLVVYTIAAFINIPPLISAVLFLAGNLVFMMLLPQFQVMTEVIVTLNINTLSMIIVAWTLNQMVYRVKIKSFLNEKIIMEKNAELKKKNRELNELTMRDSLTDLLNHKNSLRRLKEEVDRSKRINYPLSVAMIDLDNFKLVNDSYGHQTGDEVLIQVAGILRENCRATDVVGRYGGEEFIIIMPDTNDQDAALLLGRIQSCIEQTCFKDGIHITMSCGISELNGESVHGILKSSDIMLYEAKKKGKNRIEIQLNKERKSAATN